MIDKEFKKKLDCLFEYYNTFRSHAEQTRNLLRITKAGRFTHMKFSPSDKVLLEHLEKLIDESNELFPFTKNLDDFKKLLVSQNK